MACELTSTCAFFNDQTSIKPETRALLKAMRCRSDYAECARYLVAVSRGRDLVPPEMGPNDRLLALKILRSDGTHS